MTLNTTLLIFFTLIGACIGSFLNVVIYRLPAGKSLSRPGSHCPGCSKPIAWYDNIPVLAWLWLAGRCRACKARISIQYPIIEALTAILFGGWFYVCYMTDMRQEFYLFGFLRTWPVFIAYLFLFGGLLACVMIDAKYYVIPLAVTWLIVGVSLVAMPGVVAYEQWAVGAGRLEFYAALASVPKSYTTVAASIGGVVGLVVAIVGVQLNLLPRSFDQAAIEAQPNEAPDAFLAHPHPRREVFKECLFLIFPVMGFVLGSVIEFEEGTIPPWLHVLAGVCLGYLIGGAVVWAVRILGTLAFGKEAMGLGDVHLMAAIGAVTGWREPVIAFFLAPFFGLTWAVASAGAAAILKRQVRVIPYGPHLALASLIVILWRQPILARLEPILNFQL